VDNTKASLCSLISDTRDEGVFRFPALTVPMNITGTRLVEADQTGIEAAITPVQLVQYRGH
jgi:hypothetical protein